MLNALQDHLSDIYRVDSGYPVADFVITDRALAEYIGARPLHEDTNETVFVDCNNDCIGLSVFLDSELLARVAGREPTECLLAGDLSDLATVLEGVSHFNYLTWCALREKSVTLLELELQAEVDKFVATRLLALQVNESELLRGLHQRIFDDVQYHRSLNAEERERYRLANDYAARFCHRISDRLDAGNGLGELRDFYRMTQPEKIGHIHSLAWHRSEQVVQRA